MAKPASLPEWATLTDYPAGAEPEAETPTIVEPTSGQKASGWRPGQTTTAQQWNWWRNLVYLWTAYLDAGALEGDHTIDGDLDVTGDVSATGNLEIDGEFTRALWDEKWRGTGTNNSSGTTNLPYGWTSVVANAAALVHTDPSADFRGRHVVVTLPGAAGVPVYTLTPEYTLYLDNAQVVDLYQEVRTNTLAGAGSNYDVGLQFDHAGGDDYFVHFRLVNGAGNWLAVAIGSATDSDDTGVAAASDTTYKLHIRIAGSDVTGLSAGTFRATYYIDDALVATQEFTTPAADKVRYYFKSTTTSSGTGDDGFALGRVQIYYNDTSI